MSHLTFREIRGHVVLLHVTYPTVTKRVHTSTRNTETVADWIP
jgi:hypothetical protein